VCCCRVGSIKSRGEVEADQIGVEDVRGEYPSDISRSKEQDRRAGDEVVAGAEPALPLAVPPAPPPAPPTSGARHAPCGMEYWRCSRRRRGVDKRRRSSLKVRRSVSGVRCSHLNWNSELRTSNQDDSRQRPSPRSHRGRASPRGWGRWGGPFEFAQGKLSGTARVRGGPVPATTPPPAQRSFSALGGAGGEAPCDCI
jgi:hypothetical protein